jgi:lipoprotein-releasing system permease protein
MPLRKIFLYLASGIAIRGLVWGNIAGLSIALLQKQFGIFKLDPANYFLDTVPILINPLHILLLNLGAILAIFIMMIGPSYLAAKIAPVKAIKFD